MSARVLPVQGAIQTQFSRDTKTVTMMLQDGSVQIFHTTPSHLLSIVSTLGVYKSDLKSTFMVVKQNVHKYTFFWKLYSVCTNCHNLLSFTAALFYQIETCTHSKNNTLDTFQSKCCFYRTHCVRAAWSMQWGQCKKTQSDMPNGIKLEISHITCYTRANLHGRIGQELLGEERQMTEKGKAQLHPPRALRPGQRRRPPRTHPPSCLWL